MNKRHVNALTLVLALSAASVYCRAVQAEEIQSLQEVQSVAENYALAQMQDRQYTDLQVAATTLDSRLRLKACDRPLEAFGSMVGEHSGRMTVGIRCSSATPWTLYVPVQVRASVAVLSIANSLPKDSVLSANDLMVVNRTVQELPASYITDMQAAVGMQLTRSVNANALLTQAMLTQRLMINKGQEVTILADGQNFAVKMRGTALQNGTSGQRIGVKNTTSGRTVEAMIVDSGTVKVNF